MNMNNRPPPYNPYMHNMPTAPPMDNHIDNFNLQHQSQNYMYAQPSYPPPIYAAPPPPTPPFNYTNNAEQYRLDEIERRRRSKEEECCCIGILATLCCCFTNVDINY